MNVLLSFQPYEMFENDTMSPHEGVVETKWLVKTSVVLAVLLEVTQLEGSFIYRLLWNGNVLSALVLKLACLALIILPVVVFVVINGLHQLRAVKWRVAFIAIIVAINLVLTIMALLNCPCFR